MYLSLLLLPTLLFQDPTEVDLELLMNQAAGSPALEVLAIADEVELPAEEGWMVKAKEALNGADPKPSLALSRLLARADSPAGLQPLLDLLDSGDPELARASAATLGMRTFYMEAELERSLGSWLANRRIEEAPELFADVAMTLHRNGNGPSRRAALEHLRGGLASASEQTYSVAALTLGRLGELRNRAVRREVERLAGGFGPRAALAQSVLDQWEARQRMNRKLQAMEEQFSDLHGIANNDEELAVIEEILDKVENLHMEGERFSRETLIEAAADGLLRRLDPHSNFLRGPEYGKFIFDLNPEYGGIGAYVNTIDGVFTIVRPIYSGPAYSLGLRSRDRILEVDGWSTAGQSDDEIIKRLRGKPGSEVVVQVYRSGWPEARDVTIKRSKVELPTLNSEMLPGGILYLELVNFADDVGERIRDAILDPGIRSQLKGVVLDVRNNPGGFLNQAVAVCDVFLPRGKVVVRTNSRFEDEYAYRTRRSAMVPDSIPLVVLTNKYSASASEIVAGVLSQHGRAVTVGDRTFGKGSVQNLIALSRNADEPYRDSNNNRMKDDWEEFTDLNKNGKFDYGPRIKLTIAYYFLPDGTSIHTLRDDEGRVTQKGGVQPDVEVDFPYFDAWKIPEIDRMLKDDLTEDFAKRIYDEDREAALKLAVNDYAAPSSYPGWEDFYGSLETYLDEEEVRKLVRVALRRLAQDERGRVFPGLGTIRGQGDFVEDPQLQEAIRQILKEAGSEVPRVQEYAGVFPAERPLPEEPDGENSEEEEG